MYMYTFKLDDIFISLSLVLLHVDGDDEPLGVGHRQNGVLGHQVVEVKQLVVGFVT